MQFLAVKQTAKADIFGQAYDLKPLDSRLQNIEDILVTDGFSAKELLSRHPDFLVEVSFDIGKFKGFPRLVNRLDEIRPGDKVMIMRNGGIGDHIMLLPALRIFREMFPTGCEIWLSSQKEKHPIFRNNPGIDRIYPLPLRLNLLLEADCLVDFSSRDDWGDLRTVPMTDCYLDFFRIDYEKIPKKPPRIIWSPDRSPAIRHLFQEVRAEHCSKPLVLLNWRASNRLRDIPPETLIFLADRFPEVLFVAAQPKEFSRQVSKILAIHKTNICNCTPKMHSLEDYMTAISCCDAVVSTDTGAGHLAEALGKPSLILYGPTLDHLWIKYYEKAIPLRAEYHGKTCRSPCGLTKNTREGCPEAVLLGSAFSPCLLSIPGERIESSFRELLGKLPLCNAPSSPNVRSHLNGDPGPRRQPGNTRDFGGRAAPCFEKAIEP
jgi:ADP-heptose:LPS heptosyltransferase